MAEQSATRTRVKSFVIGGLCVVIAALVFFIFGGSLVG